MKAFGIHFISPNIVFIIGANGEDYIYTRSALTIGESVLIPRTSYRNMHLYMKGAKRGYQNPKSPFFRESLQTLTIIPGQMRFNDTRRLAIEADIESIPIRKEVEFKLKESINSSCTLETPFLNIPSREANQIHSLLKKNKQRYQDKTRKSEDNAIRMENGSITLYIQRDGKVKKFPMKISEYSVGEQFPNVPFVFSDKSLYLFRWLSSVAPVEELTIIPRDSYCLIEGHDNELKIKVRTKIRNDLIISQV